MPYPARVMYDIVNEVERYPEFLPWCGGVEVHQADEMMWPFNAPPGDDGIFADDFETGDVSLWSGTSP